MGLRKATVDDLAFIMEEISNGVLDGHFSEAYKFPEHLQRLCISMQKVINQSEMRIQKAGRQVELVSAELFIYDNEDGIPVGFILLAQEFSGSPDVELYIVGVKKDFRRKGYGRLMLNDVYLNVLPNTILFARCFRASKGMVSLLQSTQFTIVSKTRKGTVHLERRFIDE
ncbi:hypothetical protein BF17_00195 (plasmid) [Yersinia similis]|uniref:N-acetyltransferase domain-containing protein n=2 Tax=Yersinia similis TaxID=367190 RepID=A0ABN4CTD4_9GAMM|nr:hypothetical protein BF17_00195 [Yersinia similis]CFQ66524.1 Uncharacterised protein [Yersinia similis]